MATQTAWVTGAHGFLGRRLGRLLSGRGYDVVEIPLSVRAPLGKPPEKPRAKPFDLFFHLAADYHSPLPLTQLFNTLRLALRALEVNEVAAQQRRGRVIWLGSSAQYGIAEAVAESTSQAPVTPYGWGKMLAEQVARGVVAARGVSDFLVIRPFNLIGPGQADRFVCARMAREIVEIERGTRAPVLRVQNPGSVRDFLDADDAAEGVLKIALEGEAQGVYDLCSGQGVRIREVAEIFKRLSKVQVKLEEVEGASGDPVPQQVGRSAKARALGWRPRVRLEASFEAMLEEWRKR